LAAKIFHGYHQYNYLNVPTMPLLVDSKERENELTYGSMQANYPSANGGWPGLRGLATKTLLLFGLLMCGGATAGYGASSPGTVLTNAQQVLEVGLERSRGVNIPVQLRGVLTCAAVHKPTWFWLQDDTAAVLVIVPELPFSLASGQWLEVEGVAAPGIWSAFVQGRSVRRLGTKLLPEPKRTPASQLAAGVDFGSWVEVEATVRDVAVSKGRLLLLCCEDGLRFQVWSAHPEDMPIPLELLDARVRLQGVSWADVGYERRPFGFKLHQPGTNYIQVLKPGSADIFQSAVRPIQSLRGFSGDRNARVKVTGVVTLYSPSGWLYLQDDTGGMLAWQLAALPQDDDPQGRFIKRDQPLLQPGDRIELVGAPRQGRPFAPTLEDAQYRRLGQGALPPARVLSVGEAMSGRYDAELVRLKARVVDQENHLADGVYEQKLWLQSGENTFEVMLQTQDQRPLAVRRNDFVDVTGVCRVQPGQFQQVRTISLHLRGAGDLVIARPPRWLTWRWAAWLLGIGGAMVIAGVVWITLLQRQVMGRTAELSATNDRLQDEIQKRHQFEEELRAALAAEKELNQLKSNFVSMVSHEFRTPLGTIQSSAELLHKYYDRLTTERRQKLFDAILSFTNEMARMMEDVLLFSRVESARYDFRPRETSLAEFCSRLADEMASATHGRCPIQVSMGDLPEAARCDEGLLRHIFINLLSNAVKYSAPGSPVNLHIERDGINAVFTVRDHGMGIPAADQARLFQAFTRGTNVGDTPGTGLGLVIVRRCVTLHGGSLNLDSTPGEGTTVVVRLPLFVGPESDTALVRRWIELAGSDKP
jgi:signal transduction histidine kinase